MKKLNSPKKARINEKRTQPTERGDMKTIVLTCDISDRKHDGEVKEISIDIIFDHDQEDS